MPRKKRSNDQPIGVGLTTRQMKRKKPLSSDFLVDIEPLTDNQKKLFDAYKEQKHIIAYGCAGTGKTFITLFNALREVLDESCLLYTSPSPRDRQKSRMPSSA